jgi:hypothetical protein
MKKILLMSLMISAIYNSNAQCIADAGPDKVVCNFFGVSNDPIGGFPSATAGTPPFTYAWETEYTFGISTIYTYTASAFLNDTTLANPSFVWMSSEIDSLRFILTVFDANSQICKDTVYIKFSNLYIHPGQLGFTIQQGDSIFLNYGTNILSSTPPIEYLWRPNHGLTDSTSLSFWAKPDTSIAYYATITDSAGCTATEGPYYFIHVLPVSVEELSNLNVAIYPNPATDFIKIRKNKNDKLTFHLYNIEGKLLREFSLDKGLEEIKLTPELDSGFYFLTSAEEITSFDN